MSFRSAEGQTPPFQYDETPGRTSRFALSPEARVLRILHTNDLHGALTDAREARLAGLREQTDVYFDGGDMTGKTQVRDLDREDPVWARLERLRCDAVALGNHEIVGMMLARRDDLRGIRTPLVCANASGVLGALPSLSFERAGVRIGVIGVTTPRLHPSGRPLRRLSAAFGSALDLASEAVFGRFGLSDPLTGAREEARRLRPDVDVLILLSHLGLGGDIRLVRAVPEADIILGAHSHHQRPPSRLGGTAYAQTGDAAEFAGVYEWDGEELTGELIPLGPAG
ncbi:hypothetical protein EON77_00875 [bacterium]|nr:MAG: hypothetical protein EON77_00875 [bacterium]